MVGRKESALLRLRGLDSHVCKEPDALSCGVGPPEWGVPAANGKTALVL